MQTLLIMPPSRTSKISKIRRQIVASALYAYTVGLAAVLYASAAYWKQPYHTSALTGEGWVLELLHGHPKRIRHELGMKLHVFLAFVQEHRTTCGLTDSKHISLEEQCTIFLYMSVTGLSIRHVGERFQHANETISL